MSFQRTGCRKSYVLHIFCHSHYQAITVLLKWYSPAVSMQVEALHLLSPEQKAQLMLNPETAGLNNDSLGVVLSSLMISLTGGDVNTSNGTIWDAEFPLTYSSSSKDPLTQVRLGLSTTHLQYMKAQDLCLCIGNCNGWFLGVVM